MPDVSPRDRDPSPRLDAWENRLFGARHRDSSRGGELSPTSRWAHAARTALTLAIVVVTLAMAVMFRDAVTALDVLDKNPAVVNLNAQGVKTLVRRGVSPPCGDGDCWTDPTHSPDSAWHEIDMPRQRVSSLFEQPGNADEYYYYRLEFAVPPAWATRAEWTAFTPFYIVHTQAEVYVDGKLVAVRDGGGTAANTLVALIPRSALADGRVAVAIKGRIGTDDRGIFHGGSLYVGPKGVIDQVPLIGERLNRSMFVIYFFAAAGVFLVLSLPFLFGQATRQSFWFLLFAGAVCLENVVRGDFVAVDWLPSVRVGSYFGLRALAVVSLFGITRDFFHLRIANTVLVRSAFVLVVLVFGAAWDGYHGTRTLTGVRLATAESVLLILWGAFTLTTGLLRCRRTLRSGRGAARLREEIGLVAVALAYTSLVGYQWAFGKGSYDVRSVADLALFFLTAGVHSRLAGLRERLVVQQAQDLRRAEVDRAVAGVTRMLAHDVRKPYRQVMDKLESLSRRHAGEAVADELQDLARTVSGTLRHVDAMIEEVLGTAVVAGPLEPVSLRAVLRDLGMSSSGGLEQKVRVATEHTKQPLGYSTPLYRTLLNLVANAREASPPGAFVEVSTRDAVADVGGKTRAVVEVSVLNFGPHIPPSELSRLFEPRGVSKKRGGTGLGLAVVKRFAEACGGRVVAASDAVEGTRFTLTLVASSLDDHVLEADASSRPAPFDAPRQDLKLVILDDDPFTLDLWRAYLGDSVVAAFTDASEFVRASRAGRIPWQDVTAVITDFYFAAGDLTGDDVARHVRHEASAFRGRILLATDDLTWKGRKDLGDFDQVVGKDGAALADALAA